MQLRPLAVLAASSLPLLACGGGGDGGEGNGGRQAVEVTIGTFQFSPDPLDVPAGTTVRFTNEDPTTHTVTSGTREEPGPDRFDESLPEGATAEITFDEAGRFPYFCEIHSGPGMTGEVIVD